MPGSHCHQSRTLRWCFGLTWLVVVQEQLPYWQRLQRSPFLHYCFVIDCFVGLGWSRRRREDPSNQCSPMARLTLAAVAGRFLRRNWRRPPICSPPTSIFHCPSFRNQSRQYHLPSGSLRFPWRISRIPNRRRSRRPCRRCRRLSSSPASSSSHPLSSRSASTTRLLSWFHRLRRDQRGLSGARMRRSYQNRIHLDTSRGRRRRPSCSFTMKKYRLQSGSLSFLEMIHTRKISLGINWEMLSSVQDQQPDNCRTNILTLVVQMVERLVVYAQFELVAVLYDRQTVASNREREVECALEPTW